MSLNENSFFDSELSSLSGDSEDDQLDPEPSASRVPARRAAAVKKAPERKTRAGGAKGYMVQDCLRPPRTTQFSVQFLHGQIAKDSVDLNPDYQRDIVWSENKQIGLIDSILRNYYVPPVIFAVSILDDGTETRTCIDGKQRLTSICRFINGEIPHRDSLTGKKYWYCSPSPTSKRQLLPKNMQQMFDYKQITCMEYHDLTDDQEREIFQRVQLGVTLTPAERMAAITGPRGKFVRRMMDTTLGADGFGAALDWGRARGRDFHGVASIIYLIDNLPEHKCPVSNVLEPWLNKQTALSVKLQTHIEFTLEVFRALTLSPAHSRCFHQPVRVSPVEFVFIGVLVHAHKDRLSLAQLAQAIDAMRADVRGAFTDVRTNARVSKCLYTFITTKVASARYPGDGKSDQPAANAVRAQKAAAAAAASKKRKREALVPSSSEESSSEEEEALPRPSQRIKSSASATADTNSKTEPQGSIASAPRNKSVKNDTSAKPQLAPLTAKKPSLSPHMRTASSKLVRTGTPASASSPTASSAVKKRQSVTKHEKTPELANTSPLSPPLKTERPPSFSGPSTTSGAFNVVSSASMHSGTLQIPAVQQPGTFDPMSLLQAAGVLPQDFNIANIAAFLAAVNGVSGGLTSSTNGPIPASAPSQSSNQPNTSGTSGMAFPQHAMPPFPPNVRFNAPSQTQSISNIPRPEFTHAISTPTAQIRIPIPMAPIQANNHSIPSPAASPSSPNPPAIGTSWRSTNPPPALPPPISNAAQPSSQNVRQPPTMPARMAASRAHTSSAPIPAVTGLPPKPKSYVQTDDILSPSLSRRGPETSAGPSPMSATFGGRAPERSERDRSERNLGWRDWDKRDHGDRDRDRDQYSSRNDHHRSYNDGRSRSDRDEHPSRSYHDDRKSGVDYYGYRSDYNSGRRW